MACDLCGDGSCSCDKKIKVSFCPKCKSVNVKYVFGFGNLFGVVPKIRCGDCGFEMQSFPVLTTTKKDLDVAVKKLKSKKKAVKKTKGRKGK